MIKLFCVDLSYFLIREVLRIEISVAANLCSGDKEIARQVMVDLANGKDVLEENFLVWYDYMNCDGWIEKFPDLIEEVILNYLSSKD